MKLFRRRRTILVILVLIWGGGMTYFLTHLSGKDEDANQEYEDDLSLSLLQKDKNSILRPTQDQRWAENQGKDKQSIMVSLASM
jgi:hypothetical protein